MEHHVDRRDDASTLLDYVRVLRRRKWVVALAALLVPFSALAYSLQQSKQYQASADVYFSNQNLGAQLTNLQQSSGGVSIQADRVAQTQADLARVPTVAARALHALGVEGMTADQLLAQSSVSPKTNADLLEFKVTNGDPALASRLATEYAHQFRLYKQQLDTLNLKKASAGVQERIDQLKAQGDTKSQLYANLVENQQTLDTLAALQTSNAYVVRDAGTAVQVQPKPTRNGILGLLLGLVLGVGLAFLWEALDTRVRSTDEIGRRLHLPLLGRLPAPPKRLRTANRLAMLEEPGSPGAEAFRMLRASIEFANMDRGAKTIMVTSAVEGEGKSTTAANLAIAFALAGRRVTLIDLDLRRPFIHEFFDVAPSPGGSDVAIGAVEIVQAVHLVALGEHGQNGNGTGNGGGHGLLEVVTCGTRPPDPGEFLSKRAVSELIQRLRSRADIVIVDAPPLLHVGDGMTLSTNIDALLLVTRLQTVKRPMLDELARVLGRSPAALMGFVATGADADEAYGYGYGSYRAYGGEAPAPAREPVT